MEHDRKNTRTTRQRLRRHGIPIGVCADAQPSRRGRYFQEVFLQTVRKKPVFDSVEHEKAWLLRVTLNCLKSHWRMAWRRHDTPLDDRIPFPEPEDSALDEALRRLTPKYRAAVHLFYCEGYTAEEIARMSGEKPSTIRTRLTRARAQLRELMKGELDDGFSQAVPRHE